MCDAIVGLKQHAPIGRMRGIIKNYIYPSDEKLYYFLARELMRNGHAPKILIIK